MHLHQRRSERTLCYTWIYERTRHGDPAEIGRIDLREQRRLEFFAAMIRNRNTRMAYYRACCSFFAWLDVNGITELADIEPIHVAAYIEALQTTNAKPTVKQHLAAVRMLFDYLVVGQILTPCAAPSTSSSAARPRC
jgi:site-specific recombinase XerC